MHGLEMRNAPNYGARMPQDIQADFAMRWSA